MRRAQATGGERFHRKPELPYDCVIDFDARSAILQRGAVVKFR